MTAFIPTTGIEASRNLASSALPTAPVVDDGVPEPNWRGRPGPVRAASGTLLRRLAAIELRLADRLDPACRPSAAISTLYRGLG